MPLSIVHFPWFNVILNLSTQSNNFSRSKSNWVENWELWYIGRWTRELLSIYCQGAKKQITAWWVLVKMAKRPLSTSLRWSTPSRAPKDLSHYDPTCQRIVSSWLLLWNRVCTRCARRQEARSQGCEHGRCVRQDLRVLREDCTCSCLAAILMD